MTLTLSSAFATDAGVQPVPLLQELQHRPQPLAVPVEDGGVGLPFDGGHTNLKRVASGGELCDYSGEVAAVVAGNVGD